MADLYTSLQISPKKKRCPPEFDGNTLTPKKLRLIPPTPPPSASRLSTSSSMPSLPEGLARLYTIQTALQHALSHALATCAISPTADSGIARNVLNHISLKTYSGFVASFDLDDLKRLCWLWEWDGKSLEEKKVASVSDDEENPFISTSTASTTPADWIRGAMGIILSPATHFSKRDRKRVPAYGIGIEVEMDIDKDMGGGMAAVARWTATTEQRRSEFLKKLERWAELHPDGTTPPVPLANIPELVAPRVSALTRTLASASPSTSSAIKFPGPPASPSRSPTKRSADYGIPLPTLIRPVSPTKKSSILFPQTPSRHNRGKEGPPDTPSSTSSSPSKDSSVPSTPVHQRGSSNTPAQTPSTSRRDALYERIRQRSLSMSPTKTPRPDTSGGKMTRDQMLKMSQDEMRRRCLLGRLGGVAESIWMLFSNPSGGSTSTPSRKRRALPLADVVTAIIKSSPVPISNSEATESVSMLIKLCPFFLKKLDIAKEEWLEMPAPVTAAAIGASDGSPTKVKQAVPSSPGRLRGKEESAQELLNRSPRRVKKDNGGLREVREIIRRELELQD
ncbi:hypothetical protein BDN70DRAFT_873101 [Pholiota conissans]|uniref:DNA replication factor Cdt1 C-terminal domain-containing protein n=1 Tax=Pholiota conissans TaxID=109636 RepID=A0A9P5ZA76_9AGAR|nr:hypothetical protein BDN70DRAFT_873101 [Pholiota conissans]